MFEKSTSTEEPSPPVSASAARPLLVTCRYCSRSLRSHACSASRSRRVCALAHCLEPADWVVQVALGGGEARQQRLHPRVQQGPCLLVVGPRLGRPVAHAKRVPVAAGGWEQREEGGLVYVLHRAHLCDCPLLSGSAEGNFKLR